MCKNENKRLAELIRRLAREVAWEVVDEHTEDYEHREKRVKESELSLHE